MKDIRLSRTLLAAVAPLAAAGGAYAAPDIFCVTNGVSWARFENAHEIVAGSALDFSSLGIHHAPAGKFGWLQGAGERAAFERRPGVAARFYGVNLCNTANYLSDEQVERLTDRLVRLGYNAVRIHHHDDLWAKDADGTRAKLDRLVAVCIRKGIYLMTDLYVSRKVSWRELGIDRDGIADGDSAKLRMMVTEAGFACWKRYAADFLLHVNPETGRSLRDEPAMPFLVMINESSPHSHWDAARGIEEFHTLWKIWLAEVRAEDPGCFPQLTDDGFPARGLWWNPNAEANATSSFWAWVLARFSRRATTFLKGELGVRALLATENNGPVLPEIARTRAACGDFIDVHWYDDHTTAATPRHREESGLPLVSVFRNHNALREGRFYGYRSRAFHRVWGRPFTVSESNWGGPNVHRAVHGLAIGAYAAVQDWTGVWTFAMAHSAEKLFDGCPAAPGRFDLALDPLLQASDRMAVLLFLRGDLPTPTAAFANVLSPSDMRPSARDHLAVVPPWAASAPSLSWRVRLGVSFGELPGDVIGFGRESRGPSVADMPDSGVLIDTEQGNLSVSTPRFAGVFADVGERQDAGPLRVSIGGARACVAAASLSDDDLARAPRILVWHLTDLHGAGFAYVPFGHLSGVISWGTGRSLLAHTGSAAVALRLDDAASYDVWALDSVGNRCARVATEVREGYLCFVTVIRPNADARFYYEVVRREACAIPREDSPR